MVKLKNPLLSLNARGTISKAISFVKRRGQNIAEEKPEIKDVQSTAQLSWRHMFLKCTALWHALSAAEQAQWESLARPLHMTGYAYWQSQCLKPNPGIYLPLQGGTMQGEIDMAKYRIRRLPHPAHSQDPLRTQEYLDDIAPYLYDEGARVKYSINQVIPNITWTTLIFNLEDYDTDTIHDVAVNNHRLTCKTAGLYLIVVNTYWSIDALGYRGTQILFGGDTLIASHRLDPCTAAGIGSDYSLSTIYDLAVNEWVQARVYQSSGAGQNILTSTRFMMQRIGKSP